MKKLILFFALLTLAVSAFSQVEKIRVLNLTRNTDTTGGTIFGGIEITAEYRVPAPASLVGNAKARAIMETYVKQLHVTGVDTVDGVAYLVIQPEPLPLNIYKINANGITTSTIVTAGQIKKALETKYAQIDSFISGFTLMPFDAIIGKAWDGVNWINSINKSTE